MTKLVVIDPGHGGKDSGAIGNGLKEKDITLTIATEVARRLQEDYEGVRCLMTRSTDVYLTLNERTNMVNSSKADLLVSIHVNAGGGAGGFESFTYTTSNKATASLQNVLHTEIMNRLKQFNVTDRGQKKKDLHMCRESKMPAVLTECLFIDVAADATRLKRADVIEAFVSGHIAGSAKYLGLKPKQTQQADDTITVAVNGKSVAGGKIIDGVTMVPARAIGEALCGKVSWYPYKKHVEITVE